MHGGIDVAEVPLVSRQLPAWVQVMVLEHQIELTGGKVRIHEAQRGRVEGEVLRGEPRVLPLVRHRDHVEVVEVDPLVVTAGPALHGR